MDAESVKHTPADISVEANLPAIRQVIVFLGIWLRDHENLRRRRQRGIEPERRDVEIAILINRYKVVRPQPTELMPMRCIEAGKEVVGPPTSPFRFASVAVRVSLGRSRDSFVTR